MSATVPSTPASSVDPIAAKISAIAAAGAPYAPFTAAFGSVPNKSIDVPVSAVFIAIFAALAATHMTLFRTNKARGHFFVFSAVTFGFCMARITTFSLRIGLATHPHNISLGIAANIFISAGVILLYIINLNYTQRLIRAYHPIFGHTPLVRYAFLAYYVSVVLVLIMVIISTVLIFYTSPLSTSARLSQCKNLQKFGIVYFTVFCFLPIPLVLAARFVPSKDGVQRVKFGKKGRTNTKVGIVLAAAGLLTLEMGVRCAAALSPARLRENPKWFHERWAFYVFCPMLEVAVVVLYAVTRVDQRFFVDGKAEERARMEEAGRGEGAISMGNEDEKELKREESVE